MHIKIITFFITEWKANSNFIEKIVKNCQKYIREQWKGTCSTRYQNIWKTTEIKTT